MNIPFSFKYLPSQGMFYVSVHKLDLFVLNKRGRGGKEELSRYRKQIKNDKDSLKHVSKPSRNRNDI